MNFRSDNEVGAHPSVIEGVARAFTSGSAFSYGADEWTQRVERRLRELFDKPDLVAFPVVTGTAANSLALACCSPVSRLPGVQREQYCHRPTCYARGSRRSVGTRMQRSTISPPDRWHDAV